MIPFHSYSDYWNPNISDEVTDANWDSIDTNPMAVSLHDDFVKQVGLGPSTRFPWETERSVYYIKGFHDLHCLVSPLVAPAQTTAANVPETHSQSDCLQAQSRQPHIHPQPPLPLSRWSATRRHVHCRRYAHALSGPSPCRRRSATPMP